MGPHIPATPAEVTLGTPVNTPEDPQNFPGLWELEIFNKTLTTVANLP